MGIEEIVAAQKKFRETRITWRQFFRKKFHEGLLGFVPVVGQIPPKLRILMGMLYLFLLIAVFLILFTTGYFASRDEVYLSPATGDIADAYCELLPVENTGKFLATFGGIWQRSSGFIYSEAALLLSLFGYSTDRNTYRAFMGEVYSDLTARGAEANNSDLTHNLLYWMGWSHPDPTRKSNRISLYGDPLVLFNRDIAIFTVSNMSYDCNAVSSSQFISSTGILTAAYNIQQFSATPYCSRIMNPGLLGYDSLSRPAQFVVDFDVRAFVASMAVNLGQNNFSNLVEIAAFRRTVVDGLGVPYNISRYYDPKFPGFMFWNLGAGTGIPEILASVDIKTLHAASYRAAFITSTYGRNSPYKGLFQTRAFRQAAFNFCVVPAIGPCSIAEFSLYDTVNALWTISPDYLQLGSGACRNSITPPEDAWEALIETPFASLNQNYEKCRYSAAQMLQNQAGISFNNLQILSPFIIIFILFIVIFRHYCCCIPFQHFYNKAEKEGALDDFSIALLMTRDGRMEDYGSQHVLHHEFSMHHNMVTALDDKKPNKVSPAPPAPNAPSAPPASGVLCASMGDKHALPVSHTIIKGIVIELARNARNVAKFDNKEAVDFIKPQEGDAFAHDAEVELAQLNHDTFMPFRASMDAGDQRGSTRASVGRFVPLPVNEIDDYNTDDIPRY